MESEESIVLFGVEKSILYLIIIEQFFSPIC